MSAGAAPTRRRSGSQLRIAWRTLILAGVPQLALLETLDRLVVQERHRDHIFATVASLSIDVERGTAAAVLAGHPAPILLGGDRPHLLFDRPGGPPLGLDAMPGLVPTEVEIGDRLDAAALLRRHLRGARNRSG